MDRWILAVFGSIFALIAIGITAAFWFFAHLQPVHHYGQQPQVLAMEKHLFKHERRRDFVALFGRAIPRPDEMHESGILAGPQHPSVAFYYTETVQFCVTTFRGYEIQLDRHDRIQSWKPAQFTLGC